MLETQDLYIARYFCHAKVAFELPEKYNATYSSVDSGTPFTARWKKDFPSVDLAPGADRSHSKKKKKEILRSLHRAILQIRGSPVASVRPAASHNCALKRRAFAAICETAADRMPHNYDISWGKLACNAPCCNIATRASRDKTPRRFKGKLARCKCVSRRRKWKKRCERKLKGSNNNRLFPGQTTTVFLSLHHASQFRRKNARELILSDVMKFVFICESI